MRDTLLNEKNIIIDSHTYRVEILRKCFMPTEAPRLIVVAYQPNLDAMNLLEVCLRSIQRFTSEPHELWVIENCSPKKNTEWLYDFPNLNVAFNNNRYTEDGSYSNGVALDIAKEVIDQDSKYMMILHSDTMVCKDGWLSFLMSKLNNKTSAVGVRLETSRVPDGVLHNAGYIVDFQLVKKLNLSFMPQLPKYDIGDLVIFNVKKEGHDIFACRNTFTQPELVNSIPAVSLFRNLHADRALDDNGEVFFLHLGRGIVKSTGGYKDKRKTTPKQWIRFADNYVLSYSYNPNRLSHEAVSPLFSRLDYSLRRYYVDEFYERNIRMFPKSATILDIGGKKRKKRGQFDIEKHLLKVKYVNIDPSTDPNYLCDGSNITVEDNSFDAVICSEVLEHVKEPLLILKEGFRVLKTGGSIYIAVPFLLRIHPDPDDFGRYTDQYLRTMLKEIGFNNIIIERQGLFWSVVVEMLRSYVHEMQKEGRPKYRILRWFLPRMVAYGKRKALEVEQRGYFKYHPFFNSYTTGYGIIAQKNVSETDK